MRGARKGSMQLSIEAIIILVIAMVLLGLAIGFIRTFFTLGQETLVKPFDSLEFGCTPDASDSISFSPSEPELKSGSKIRPQICVYAREPAEEGNEADIEITGCVDTNGGVDLQPKLLTQSQPISRTEIGGFNTILTAEAEGTSDSLPVGTYICTFKASTKSGKTLGTKQVTISII